ncbi:hypothetical protein [Streptomyces sp. NPDC048248]
MAAEARELGLDQVQWQTPPWNTAANRFCAWLGPQAKEELHHHLSVD